MMGLPRGVSQEKKLRALSGRVIYRTKEEVYDWNDSPIFPRRDVRLPRYAENPPEYNTVLSDIATYFDWIQDELRMFTISPSRPVRVPVEKDIIEEIIWSNIRKDEEIPSNLIDGLLSQTEFLEKVSSQDVRIRKELCNEVKDEQGNWCGAVWPLGITILFPAESGAPQITGQPVA